jgi:hypothetical protein
LKDWTGRGAPAAAASAHPGKDGSTQGIEIFHRQEIGTGRNIGKIKLEFVRHEINKNMCE